MFERSWVWIQNGSFLKFMFCTNLPMLKKIEYNQKEAGNGLAHSKIFFFIVFVFNKVTSPICRLKSQDLSSWSRSSIQETDLNNFLSSHPIVQDGIFSADFSVTRLGGFWKSRGTKFTTKTAQILCDFLGLLENGPFKKKLLLLLLDTFGLFLIQHPSSGRSGWLSASSEKCKKAASNSFSKLNTFVRPNFSIYLSITDRQGIATFFHLQEPVFIFNKEF